MPRFRFRLRGMMVVVAICAVLFLGIRWYSTYRTWSWWLTHTMVDPIAVTMFSPSFVDGNDIPLGRPIPIKVDYAFRFNKPKPLPGMTFLVWGEFWIEDLESRTVVEGYTFDVTLTPGIRESASGRFTWEPVITRPGRYNVKYQLRYRDPLGEWKSPMGGGMFMNRPTIPNAPSPFSE